jgi:hypothetical protein
MALPATATASSEPVATKMPVAPTTIRPAQMSPM